MFGILIGACESAAFLEENDDGVDIGREDEVVTSVVALIDVVVVVVVAVVFSDNDGVEIGRDWEHGRN